MTQTFRLMVPGPTPMPQQVMNEMAQPMLYHRDEDFSKIFFSAIEMLKELLNTEKGDVLIIPSSGRGGMEASIVNLFSPGDKILAVTNGYFGEMFADMARRFNLEVIHLKFNWDEILDCSIIEDAIRKDMEIKGILVTHCETSNAVENDLKAIGEVAQKYNKLMVVDAVSSLGCMPIKMDEWGIDVVVSASQKGLMCPAGLSLVGISQQAWTAIESSHSPRFYFDFCTMRTYIEKGQTPVSTPVPLVRALNVALSLMKSETYNKVYKRHDTLSDYIKRQALGLCYKLYPSNLSIKRANSLSAFSLPSNVDAIGIVEHARNKYNTLFAKGLGKNASSVLRVGHMGWFHEEDATHMLHVLKGISEYFGLQD